MQLAAILFDIDDTLFPSSQFADAARRSAVEAIVNAGLEVDVSVAMEELHAVVKEFSSNYGHHFDQLVVRLAPNLRDGVHKALVIAAGVRAYHETKAQLAPFPDVVRCLEKLSHTSLIRGVLTNGLTIKQAEKLVRLDLQHAFSPGAIFISEDLGVAKPHPRIFQIACEALQVDPGEVLYIGDNPIKDVDAAHEAGLITCLRRGAGKHSMDVGAHAPDFEVTSLDELHPWLASEFGIQ
ncbi:MAG: TIGR02253 family HAD-type hydrolase [Planctomycetota bacterium]|jgi:putative hydrolase of the HAD superfamily